MHIFLKFKDSRLQNIYEEEQLKQFCLNLKLYRPFTALVIVLQFVFIIFDYIWSQNLPDCDGRLTSFIVGIVLILLESIVLYMYFAQSEKNRKKLSALLELIFTLIFTSSYILSSQVILTCVSDAGVSKEMVIAFTLKVGTEFLWRYVFIAFVCKLWISQILNVFFSLGWVVIWIINMNQALLIVQVFFNIFIWLFTLCFSEKIKRLSFLKAKDFHDKELIYKNIFDIVPEYIFVLDNQGKIRHVNKFAQESLGGDIRCLEKLRDLRWRRNVSIRRSDLSDTSPVSDKRAKPIIHIRGSLEATSNALESVGTFVDIHKLFKQNLFEVVGENAAVYDCKYADESNYQKRSFELKVSSIRNQLERFLLVTLKDTTERDMIVALESENVVYRNNLLASFSHELRTPLNGTICFMEQLMDAEEIPDEAKNKYVQPALSSAKLLVFLIQDILDYSQLLLNKFDVRFSLNRISETVWDCFSLFEHKFKEKNLEYDINVSPAVPNYTYTDHKRISQILINILTNAVRFTMSGKIWIEVDAIKNQTLRITVGDTGIGMDENTKTRLRYHLNSGMLKGKISSSSAGIGMGLTIAHRIAQKLGPNEDEGLEFESTFGEGSQFSFKVQNRIEDASLDDIDLALSDVVEFDGKRKLSKGISHLHLARSPIPSHRESVFGFEPMSLVKPRVLIVDDDAFNIVALETICHMLKLKTERAFHGKEALEKLIASNSKNQRGTESEPPYKIVFMDCNMPVMDGFEATRLIKEMIWKGEIEEVKVIGVTAYVGENDVKKCFSSGMDEVLNKPVFKKTLVETLKKYTVID